MAFEYKFRTDTDLSNGLFKLLERLESALELTRPVTMYLAGGMAAHLYVGARVTTDVDAEFSRRIFIPDDLLVKTDGGNILYIDTNYSSTFALMHDDYLDDAVAVPLGLKMIDLRVLSPVDLVVSKIARYSDHDREDIESVISAGLVTVDEIEGRAREALGGYIGNTRFVEINLQEVVTLGRDIELRRLEKSKADAEHIARERGSFEYADLTAERTIVGRVMGLTDRHVVLSLGRSAAIVEKSDLSCVPAKDENVTITVKGGKAIVVDQRAKEMDRGR